MYPRVFTKEGSCGAPQNILGLEPLKALIRPWQYGAQCRCPRETQPETMEGGVQRKVARHGCSRGDDAVWRCAVV